MINFNFNFNGENPFKIYNNFQNDKNQILLENKDKTGVYCIINKTNGCLYVGKSINLSRRINNYFQNSYLNKRSGLIYPALLKYGHSCFSLAILEYCDKNLLNQRENYYIKTLDSKYNIQGKN